MSTAPDASPADFERSRAAVAVACLQWLRCTGPTTGPEVAREAARPTPPDGPDRIARPDDLPHPLWDRWIDG